VKKTVDIRIDSRKKRKKGDCQKLQFSDDNFYVNKVAKNIVMVTKERKDEKK